MKPSTKQHLAACIALLAFGAPAPTSAIAAEAGWWVNGTQLSGSAALATTASVDEDSVLTAAGVTVKCTGSDLYETLPQIESPNKASAAGLTFTGCTAAGENCSLTGQNAGGEVGTLPVTATVELQSGSSKVVLATFSPQTGTTFATIAFTGSGCALPGKEPIDGKALVEDPTGQEEKAPRDQSHHDKRIGRPKDRRNSSQPDGCRITQTRERTNMELCSRTGKKESGWMVNGTQLSGSAALNTTAPVVEESTLTFVGVTIKCKGSYLYGTQPQIGSPSKGSAQSLTFAGCEAESTNGHTCHLSGQDISGEVGTLPISAEVEAKSGSTKAILAHLKPKTGTTLATIAFTGSGCALVGKQAVTGEALIEGPTGQEEKSEQEIRAITTKSTEELKVGSSAASLEGAATLTLASGDTWSYL